MVFGPHGARNQHGCSIILNPQHCFIDRFLPWGKPAVNGNGAGKIAGVIGIFGRYIHQ